MLKFLLQLSYKHKKVVLSVLASILPVLGGIWNFDFQKLFLHTTLTPDVLWEIRIGLTLILPSLYLLAFFILLLYSYKKDIEKLSYRPKRTVISKGIEL
ncbi:MAG: hypothetical protein Q7K45_05935 [Nanoarchaeota archaeon]|nr:hypothetical protein [Nanoarchaeota archaeon]